MAKQQGNKAQPVKAADLVEASPRVQGDEPRTVLVGDGPGDDDDDEIEGAELASFEPEGPPPELPKAAAPTALPGPTVVQAAVPYQPRVIYHPDRKQHMSEMGPVATRNFTAVVRGCRVDVKFGAPRKRIPREVIELMERAGVDFAHAQPPQPPPGSGATVSRERRNEPPRARRTERRPEDVDRRFRPVQGIGAQGAY